MEETLLKLVEKFQKAKIYIDLKEVQKAEEILKSITDFEIEILELTGKQFMEWAKQLKEIKEEK